MQKEAAAKGGEAREETENVQRVAQADHDRLATLAERAPADTQNFADAAETWAKAVLADRSAVIAGARAESGKAAMLNIRLAAQKLDSEAARLDITPWHKLDQS
ncbi:hypothetical protein HEK616_77170 (plasmid) [Streptomyces nigrescens]|uniref:Uncharacterized protein n=2 Tax=Streptomyces TaxID=1883 RepID=A0ABM8A6K6_STRNI|nr:hypothetical protein [Streptomyces nigrescens]MEE4419053.1 hypothetical protein [Streptomyces sp. DSM 41528]BDM74230.1 hypothetical protein HEK616_77170 [Streptomyces nigrescens]